MPSKPDGKGETLREKAMKAVDGPDANPSELGDPISLKAETSERAPTDSEEGSNAHQQQQSSGAQQAGDEPAPSVEQAGIRPDGTTGTPERDRKARSGGAGVDALSQKSVEQVHGSQGRSTDRRASTEVVERGTKGWKSKL